MATITVNSTGIASNRSIKFGTLAFDSSYPTGGESFDPVALGLSEIESIVFNSTSGYVFEYDSTNKKVIVRGQDPTDATVGVIAFSEVADTTDLAAVTVTFMAVGR